jgi:methyl-accepting chemotaxis protein-1 (serine sensor receptor)
MNNFKLSTRLTVLIGFLSLVMIVIGVFGLYGISESNRRFKVVYEERLVALGDLLEVQRLLLRNRNAISTAIAIHTPEYTRQKHQEVQTNIEDVNRSWSAFRQTKLTQEEAQMADRFEAERARFLQGFLKPAQQALESADMELARQLLIDKDEALYAPLRDLIVELTSLQTRIAKEEYEAAQSLYQVVFAVAVGSIIAGVLLGVLLGWSIIRNMARSLRQAIHTADAVAAGDLTQQIDVRGKDEVSMLLRALQTMQEGLRGVVRQVHQGSVSVAAASGQIAQANQDLSARTESQASALQETAASMEQLSSTVKQNADNAHANDERFALAA